MRRPMTPRLIATFAFAAASLAAVAHAECVDDTDCSDGFVCEVVAESACAEPPPCEPGADCIDEEPLPCEPEEITACVPELVDCDTDADCDGGLTCVSFTYEECDGMDIPIATDDPGAPDPDNGDREEPADFDGPGDTPDEFECEEITEAFCAPAWVGACEVDSDCGDGFACVEAEVCECSSSGGSSGGMPPAPGGSPEPMPDGDGSSDGGEGEDPGREMDAPIDEGEADCSCFGTGELYCEPVEVACASDGDCPAEWSCESMGMGVACTFDAETGEEICEESSGDMYCTPPSWDVWGGAVGGTDDTSNLIGERGSAANDDAAEGGPLEPVNPRAPADESCAASGAAPSGSWLLLLAGLVGLRRRHA